MSPAPTPQEWLDDNDTIKTVTKQGKEFSYDFVEARDSWPEGFR